MGQVNQMYAWRITPAKVDEAVRRIVAAANPSRVILFGSYCRGEHDRDSDLDILIVKKKVGNRYLELLQLGKALRGLMLATDLLLVEENELNEWRNVPGSVYRAAVREGKVVYEAA
jgi:predicted nucleotidyltransferase